MLMFENGNSFISDILGGPSFKLARPVSNRLRTKTENRLSRQKRPPSFPRMQCRRGLQSVLICSKFAVVLQTFVPALQLNSSQMSSSPRQSTRNSLSQNLQGSAKTLDQSLVNFVPALAYHFCRALPAVFTQPGGHLLPL